MLYGKDGQITNDQQQLIDRDSIQIGSSSPDSTFTISTTSSTPIFNYDKAAYTQNSTSLGYDTANKDELKRIIKSIQYKIARLGNVEFEYTATKRLTFRWVENRFFLHCSCLHI